MTKHLAFTQPLNRLENSSSSAIIIAISISCFIHFVLLTLKNSNAEYSLAHLPLQIVISQIDSIPNQTTPSVETLRDSTANRVKAVAEQPEKLNRPEKPAPFVNTPAHKPQRLNNAQNQVSVTHPSSLQNTMKSPAFDTTKILRTSAIVREASYLNNPPPGYPGRARKMGLEGELLLRVRVLQDGSADQLIVKKSSGSSLLDNASLRAVRGWQFIPAYQGDNMISSWVEIPIRFKLDAY